MIEHQSTTESIAVMTAKAAPPVTVSLASFAGVPVSDMVLWGTLIYTVLLIAHKVYQIWKDVRSERKGEVDS